MSKLEDLIAELCPSGVSHKKVKEVYTRIKGTPITAGKMKEIEKPDGNIRIFAGGRTVINARENDIPHANITRVPAVIVQSRGIIDVVFYDKPFTFKNEMWAYTCPEIASIKFLYYVFKNNIQKFRDAASGMGSLPQISLPVTEEFIIPFPPLPIQREIVKILDCFVELSEELSSELLYRKKQYKYYRDLLLTFSKENETHERSTTRLDNVRWAKIKDFCSISRGKVISKDYIRDNQGEYPVYSSQTENNGLFGSISDYMYDGEFITWTTDGANAGTVFHRSGKFNITNVCGLLKPDDEVINIRYLYYALSIVAKKYVNDGMGNPKLMSNVMSEIKIPIPPMQEQKRIVSILNYFDALCNDTNNGLPAEISARQKQYEYYRNKLLSFRERKDVV